MHFLEVNGFSGCISCSLWQLLQFSELQETLLICAFKFIFWIKNIHYLIGKVNVHQFKTQTKNILVTYEPCDMVDHEM